MTQNPSQYPTESRPARKRALRWLWLVMVLLLLGGVWLLFEHRPQWGRGQVTETDSDLGIRLLGIRPDDSDTLYGPDGKEIGEHIVYGRDSNWKADELRRDFLIEIAPTRGPVCWLRPAIVRPSGSDALWGGLVMFSGPVRALDGKERLILECRLNKEYRDSFGIGPIRFFRTVQVSYVDVHLRYYHGDRGPADARFLGPFSAGKACFDPNHPGYQMTFGRRGSNEQIEIKANQRYDPSTPALIYDRDGKVYLPNYGGGSFSNNSCTIEYTLNGLPIGISDIARITFNETPHKVVLRGIPVLFDGLPQRSYALHLDEIAERLGCPVFQNGRMSAFSIQDPCEAIAIMDVARSQYMIGRIVDCVWHNQRELRPEDLGQEQRTQVMKTAETWANAADPVVRASGIRLGLWVNPQSYTARALAALQQADSEQADLSSSIVQPLAYSDSSRWRSTLAHTVQQVRQHLTRAQMLEMADLLIERYDPAIYGSLINCIRWNYRNLNSLDALKKLAEADQPRLWVAVIGDSSASLLALRDARGLSPKVRMRAAALGLKKGVWYPDLDISQEQRLEILRSVLTPRMLQLSVSLFSRALKAVCENTSPDEATRVVMAFLRQLNSEWDTWQTPNHSSNNWWGVDRCVKYLNLWHDVNIGGLGQDVNRETRDDRRFDWQAIILEALAWAETGTDPGKLPRGWRPEAGDIRIVWKNMQRPELSAISVWRAQQSQTDSITWRPLTLVHDFLNLRILGRLDQPGTRQVEMKFGIKNQHSTSQEATLETPLQQTHQLRTKTYTGSVGRYSDGTEVRDRTWLGDWEVWLEPAAARQSAVSDTQLFTDWSRQYLDPNGIETSLPVTYDRHTKSALREYLLSLRDYSDWTPAEIALRQAMDQDVNYRGWDIRPVSEPVRARAAVAAWERFLERDDMTPEMQIVAWWRIAQYCTSLAPHEDDRPDFRKAVPALVQAMSIDPEYVCDATIYSASHLVSLVGVSHRGLGFTAMERARMFADCVIWLQTRTDEMIAQSVRRPLVFNFGNDVFPLRTLRNDSEDDLRRRQEGTRRQLNQVLDWVKANLGRRMQTFRREDPAAAQYLEGRLQGIHNEQTHSP